VSYLVRERLPPTPSPTPRQRLPQPHSTPRTLHSPAAPSPRALHRRCGGPQVVRLNLTCMESSIIRVETTEPREPGLPRLVHHELVGKTVVRPPPPPPVLTGHVSSLPRTNWTC